MLACKYVDEVVLNAPWALTREMISNLSIKAVAAGTTGTSDQLWLEDERPDEDPYIIPKEMNIFHRIESHSELTTDVIAERVLKNRQMYMSAYEKKKKKQDNYQQESTQWRGDLQEL